MADRKGYYDLDRISKNIQNQKPVPPSTGRLRVLENRIKSLRDDIHSKEHERNGLLRRTDDTRKILEDERSGLRHSSTEIKDLHDRLEMSMKNADLIKTQVASLNQEINRLIGESRQFSQQQDQAHAARLMARRTRSTNFSTYRQQTAPPYHQHRLRVRAGALEDKIEQLERAQRSHLSDADYHEK